MMGAKQVIFKYANRAVKDAQQTGMGVHDGIARLHYGHIQWMMDTINKQEAQLRTLAEAVLESHTNSCENCPEEAVRACSGQDVDFNVNCCQCEACKLAREVMDGK